jgi:pimeloyl-ACP methyl ester carboxylesterase
MLTSGKIIGVCQQGYTIQCNSVLGHSWGGFLAMQYTIAHPEHVDKLIQSNSAPASSEGYALYAPPNTS